MYIICAHVCVGQKITFTKMFPDEMGTRALFLGLLNCFFELLLVNALHNIPGLSAGHTQCSSTPCLMDLYRRKTLLAFLGVVSSFHNAQQKISFLVLGNAFGDRASDMLLGMKLPLTLSAATNKSRSLNSIIKTRKNVIQSTCFALTVAEIQAKSEGHDTDPHRATRLRAVP